VATTKRTRSTTSKTGTKTKSAKKAPAKKTAARKTAAKKTTRKTASTRAAAPDPELDELETLEVAEAMTQPAAEPVAVAPLARSLSPLPPTEPPARRAVFFDVENTSRAEDVQRVLDYLGVDFTRGNLEFLAVGNWRVIGHDPARMLAAQGASLVHSAPSTGVRDWSDLRIAVAAGVWMATANPGDVVDIVSDDQAFDAVGDVAAGRGVTFRRLSYRSLAGLARAAGVSRPESAARTESGDPLRARRRRRGGRGRTGRRREDEGSMATGATSSTSGPARRAPAPSRPAPSRSAPPAPRPSEPVHTAPLDELVGVVQELVAASPDGINLDTVANALRERGFRRKAGSPRLITRLRLIKDNEEARDGKIRLASSALPIADDPIDDGVDDAVDDAALGAVGDDGEPAGNGAAGGNGRRRRRRGGRRRRGRGASDQAADGAAVS
jgi:hypothetical protein